MEYTVGNYTFKDEETAKKARKEAETIAFIRNRSDLSKPENITKIINTIVDNRMFETQVGLDFLEELKNFERRGEGMTRPSAKPVPAAPVNNAPAAKPAPAAPVNSAPAAKPAVDSAEADSEGKSESDSYDDDEAHTFAPADEEVIRAEVVRRTKHLKESAEDRVEKIREAYKDKARNMKIVIVALIAVIIGLLVLTFLSDNSPFIDAEQKVIDNYSSWSERLTQKEEKLRAWENELKAREEKLNNK